MLRLFHSIFGGAPVVDRQYPERLVDAATERALDGTDPRLRILPGYREKLRPIVIHAIDHVVRLVERLPSPVELSRKGYSADTRLAAFFASPDHLVEVVNTDQNVSAYLARTEAAAAERIIALLVTVKRERNVLGIELEGEILKRDVSQITVSFANHRVVDPATTEEETRRLLKRRAFDHLLGIALGRIAHVRKKRAGLEQQRTLLRRKLMVLRSGRWGFDETRGRAVSDVAAVETQLGEIEEQLQELGADAGVLQLHLDILSEVLSRAEQQLWATPAPLILDRMNIKRDHARGNAHEIALQELHSASGRTAILLPVVVPRSELRPRADLFVEAQRNLA